ncbi:MAG TPA: hypothetical protein VNA12_04100, partial [Mycobacteriales bacterium]|nr:hypothetical protein [Mycobacteriales bacterium]
RTTTLLASVQRYATSAGLAYDMCLAPRGALCQTGSVGGGSGVALTDATATTSITAMYFYPGEISPSAYDAVFTTAGAGVPDRVRAFALSIG